MEQLIFGGADNQRFTQDSPILPEVWLKFALHPDKARDLILIPDRSSNAGAFANDLNDRLRAYRRHLPSRLRTVDLRDGRGKRARIAHLPGVVAARLYFDEFLRLVLPATPWWRKMVNRYRDKLEELEDKGKLKGRSPYRQFADPNKPLDLDKALAGKTSKTSTDAHALNLSRISSVLAGMAPRLVDRINSALAGTAPPLVGRINSALHVRTL